MVVGGEAIESPISIEPEPIPKRILDLAFGEWDLEEVGDLSTLDAPALAPDPEPDPAALEALWKASGETVGVFAIHRVADYWQWRYLDHPEFEYLFFGDPTSQGVVVGRIEQCRPKGADGPVRSVLRVIEVVPRALDGWEGRPDPAIVTVLRGALAWARAEGCCAADYRNAYRRVVGIFREEGATNVAFVMVYMGWTFDGRSGRDPLAWWPGDDVIDWVGSDPYNWAPRKPGAPWDELSKAAAASKK